MSRCGHSHLKIDQKFSEVHGALCQSPVLEVPQDFKVAIEPRVKPRGGRKLSVEIINNSRDYKLHFQNLGNTVSGHTQTREKFLRFEQAVHVFQFERFESYTEDQPGTAWAQDIVNIPGLATTLGQNRPWRHVYISYTRLDVHTYI